MRAMSVWKRAVLAVLTAGLLIGVLFATGLLKTRSGGQDSEDTEAPDAKTTED